MTTSSNHAAGLWHPGITGKSALLRQYGAPRGLQHPAPIGFIEFGGKIYDGDPTGTGGPIHIFPYAFTWPLALAPSDSVGVAFPAGMIAVVFKAWLPCHVSGPPSPPFGPPVTIDYTGSVNDGLEMYWTSSTLNAGAIAVPNVLPVGYTVNRQTAFASRDPLAFSDAYFTATGPVRPAWQAGVGCGLFGGEVTSLESLAARTGPDGSGNFKWWFSVHAGVGLRKFQFRIDSAGAAWTARLSHNADGSDPGTNEGDTADYSTSGGSGTSGFFDVGALTPTLGTFTRYVLSVESASGFTSITRRSSCRTDVPIPYTVPGLGDLIAPGGYFP